MKRKINILLLVLVVGLSPALVSAGDRLDVKELSELSGLSERQVRMLMAPARSAFAEYRYAFDRAERKLIEAVGEEEYRAIVAGTPVRIERRNDGRQVAVVITQ